MAVSTGENDLRKLNVEKTVTGFALTEYVFKQLCIVSGSSSWQERFFQETAADLTNAGSPVKGVPRLAGFPQGEVTFTQVDSFMLKHGMEGRIAWEDAMTNDVDVIARTLLRIARAVTKSVDTDIWNVLTENQSASTINSQSITAGNEWDSATVANRDPIQDILNAKRKIAEANYNPDNGDGFLLLNPKDYANLLGNANVRNAGQFWTDSVTRNGRVGSLLGLTVIVSNNVTADFAAVIIAKEAATYKVVSNLTVRTIENPGIDWNIRAWEVGITQLKNPQAVTLIDNTAA